MSIILIVIYCLVAVLFLFGLTFHDELRKERRPRKKAQVIPIDGGRRHMARLHRHG